MIVACGPEGNGTTILATMLGAFIRQVEHLSLPYAGIWWATPQPFDPRTHLPFPQGTRFVVVQRRPDVAALSMLAKKPPVVGSIQMAREHWRDAIQDLASLTPALWVTYEALIHDAKSQMENVAGWLGIAPPTLLPEMRDENAKWLSLLEP